MFGGDQFGVLLGNQFLEIYKLVYCFVGAEEVYYLVGVEVPNFFQVFYGLLGFYSKDLCVESLLSGLVGGLVDMFWVVWAGGVFPVEYFRGLL